MSASPDPSTDGAVSPTKAIIEAVAAREHVDVTDVEPPAYEPLYSVVNPEALDQLFQTPDGTSASSVRVTLEYEGYEVVVRGDGDVDVAEAATGDRVGDAIEE